MFGFTDVLELGGGAAVAETADTMGGCWLERAGGGGGRTLLAVTEDFEAKSSVEAVGALCGLC